LLLLLLSSIPLTYRFLPLHEAIIKLFFSFISLLAQRNEPKKRHPGQGLLLRTSEVSLRPGQKIPCISE